MRRSFKIFISLFAFLGLFFFTAMSASAFEPDLQIESTDEITINNETIVDPGGTGYYYPGTKVKAKPGDILYVPTYETQYFTGHVGVVDHTGYYVVHTPGKNKPGIERIFISQYLNKFDNVSVWQLNSNTYETSIGRYAYDLWVNYRNASYTVFTTLTGPKDKQYCTKLVWQAYYYGSNKKINLGDFSLTKMTVPPKSILDWDHLTRKATGL